MLVYTLSLVLEVESQSRGSCVSEPSLSPCCKRLGEGGSKGRWELLGLRRWVSRLGTSYMIMKTQVQSPEPTQKPSAIAHITCNPSTPVAT